MTEFLGVPDCVPLAMINAIAYCPRRFVYEFVYAEMLLNEHVVEGSLLHEGVDLGGRVWPGAERVQERRVYVWSERLRLVGFCDVVETDGGVVYPVEYKKGKPNRWRNDHAQLCAQAMCLEERMGVSVLRGAIFYFSVRRREEVAFSADVRTDVVRLAGEAHRLASSGVLPPPLEQRAKCRECSLEPLCLPAEVQVLKGGKVRGRPQVRGWEEQV